MNHIVDAAREQRILDAAAKLFVHFGYDKTTVADIAREAGISKGAVYLHFESKDQLFEELLLRELGRHGDRWIALIEADPAGGTIVGIYTALLRALHEHPFMLAMMRQDAHVFGNYLRKPDNFFRANRYRTTRHELVAMMQEAGAMRRDIDPVVAAHVMNVFSYGLVAIHDVLDAADVPPLDDVIEGIALIMDRALTPADGGDSEVGKAIIRKMAAASKARFEERRQRSKGAP